MVKEERSFRKSDYNKSNNLVTIEQIDKTCLKHLFVDGFTKYIFSKAVVKQKLMSVLSGIKNLNKIIHFI